MVKAKDKQQTAAFLRLQIAVRDKLIGNLLHTIAENKIKLQPNIIAVIGTLYQKLKIVEKENEPERKSN